MLAVLVAAALIAAPLQGAQERPGATPQRPKLDLALQRAVQTSTESLRVIIQAVPGGREAVEQAVRDRGRKIANQFWSVNAIAAELSAADLHGLSSNPAVASMSIDAIVVSATAEGGTQNAAYTLRETLGLPLHGPSGEGIGVAVIDSGIDPTDDLTGRVVAFYDFTGQVANDTREDRFGHGTHVSGLIAGDGRLSENFKYQGIAPSSSPSRTDIP